MGIETIVFAAIAVASASYAAYSSHQQGKAAEKQADYNAQAERNNQIASQQQGDFELTRTREKYRRIRATQKAAASVSGITDGGSFNDIINDTNLQEDLDTLSVLYKAKADMTGSEQRRQLGNMQGSQARKAANQQAVGSLLSSAGSIYGNYPTVSN